MIDSEARLQVLSCEDGTGAPTLQEEWSSEVLAKPPRPFLGGADKKAAAKHLAAFGDDPNDLALQRWGVVAEEGSHGTALIAAIGRLIGVRAEQQGLDVTILRVPRGMNLVRSLAWRDDVYDRLREDDRPRYLLILGEPEAVSYDFQYVLGQSAFVGRLVGSNLADYEAYAAKATVETTAVRRSMTTWIADDGTLATTIARGQLVDPLRELLSSWSVRRELKDVETREGSARDLDELVDEAGALEGGVLMSVSHGVAAPKTGWSSAETQRARQGALSLGGGAALTAEALGARPFVPRGLWFYLACFGAGTATTSPFEPWLTSLTARGVSGAERVRRGLPLDSLPFCSSLATSLLASPVGPLAIVGHVDLAWTYAFTRPDAPNRSAAIGIERVCADWARGRRAGVGFDHLMRNYREDNDALLSMYQDAETAQMEGKPDPTDPALLSRRWMARNDLRGYVLLGDPAARIGSV